MIPKFSVDFQIYSLFCRISAVYTICYIIYIFVNLGMLLIMNY